MGWEKRGERKYYYRKRRVGERVVSEYVGTGRAIDLMAQLDVLEKDKAETERRVQRIGRQEVEALDKELGQVYALIEALTATTLRANGFHKHRGQWRRAR